MNKLINVTKIVIGQGEVNAVSARELYLGLGLASQHWSAWAKVNIEENGFFKQSIDFIQLPSNGSSPNPPKEFAVSLEMAKHLAMMAKTAKGNDYRNYFLELEKAALEPKLTPVSPNELIMMMAKANIELEKKVDATQHEVKQVAAKVEQITVDLRNGVPHGFISRKNARQMYAKGLSQAVFEEVMTIMQVPIQHYVSYGDGHSTATFAYQEDRIPTAVSHFIRDLEQNTKCMCFSTILNKRVNYIKKPQYGLKAA